MGVGVGDNGDAEPFVLPRIPASSGALIFDQRGRLLIANPTYKAHWTIPGGIMEADGETPWEACRREVREEVGLTVEEGSSATEVGFRFVSVTRHLFRIAR